MNNRYLISILLLAILLISACKPEITQKGPFKGGTSGVGISFVANYPPSKFDVGESVPVKVLLSNKGEFDLNPNEAEVQLYGIHRPSFGISDEYLKATNDLPGIGVIQTGGEQEVDIGKIAYSQAVQNSEQFTLRAKVCYPYETDSQIKACISSVNIEESKGEKVCGITGEKITQGSVSSAPIQITSFTEEFRGADKIVFNIAIENKGVGNVYTLDSLCSELDDPDFRLDNENVLLFTITPSDIECRFSAGTGSSGEVRLRERLANVVCTKQVSETDSSFEQNIIVNLKYKYVDSTSTNFEIFEVQ
ncbi:hypothetical protein J4455_04510 [Candidatus Woesearchaeota archaeon]|nr:hypothetical protein [Candidatus Woesearchaeota archaeon]